MAKPKQILAAGLSLMLHGSVWVAVLRQPESQPNARVEAVEVTFQTVKPSIADVTMGAHTDTSAQLGTVPPKPTRRTGPLPQASEPKTNQELNPSTPESSPSQTPSSDASESSALSLGKTGPPSATNALGGEAAHPLFPHALPNVLRRSKPSGQAGSVEGRGGVKMHVDEDGNISRFEGPGVQVTPLGVSFDVTDMLMRMGGKHPYRYEEHRLAEATREARIGQMVQAEKGHQRQALYDLNERLLKIWRLPNTPILERQKLIFETWDECTEETERDSPGAMARATIEAFVRHHMPINTPEAYTPTLLAALNEHRTSKSPFAPYHQPNAPDTAQ